MPEREGRGTNHADDPAQAGPADSILVDLRGGVVRVTGETGTESHPLGSAEGFAAVSRAWIRAGWDAKYVYGFAWMGRPIIQLPEDLVRIQEVIYRVQPDVIVECGVAHGGSLVFYASLLKAMGKGRVIGIDVEIRPHNRQAIEAHPLADLITLVEGSSIDAAIVQRVTAQIAEDETVLVALDSGHSRDHVLAELEAYGPAVSVGSYIVAMDGIMETLRGAPRTEDDWSWNNPAAAAREFVARHPAFALEEPDWPFNEGNVTSRVTYWPSGYIRRVR